MIFEQVTLIQGYWDYKLNVTRIAYGTMKDIKCSLKRVERAMDNIASDTVLWECKLSDFMKWIEVERN